MTLLHIKSVCIQEKIKHTGEQYSIYAFSTFSPEFISDKDVERFFNI